ncbi:MAG: hypothetical protein H7343_11045 [Undibacterium sp.]|nr:hypothetical protein [Opitutaceae bacterium]
MNNEPTTNNATNNATPTRTNADILASLICDAEVASAEIIAAKREVCAEYAERLRKLRDVKVALHIARGKNSEEMFDVGSVLSPEILRLLSDPTNGL